MSEQTKYFDIPEDLPVEVMDEIVEYFDLAEVNGHVHTDRIHCMTCQEYVQEIIKRHQNGDQS